MGGFVTHTIGTPTYLFDKTLSFYFAKISFIIVIKRKGFQNGKLALHSLRIEEAEAEKSL
jgi:hypothetical protein